MYHAMNRSSHVQTTISSSKPGPIPHASYNPLTLQCNFRHLAKTPPEIWEGTKPDYRGMLCLKHIIEN